jgi:hypothetical protein
MLQRLAAAVGFLVLLGALNYSDFVWIGHERPITSFQHQVVLHVGWHPSVWVRVFRVFEITMFLKPKLLNSAPMPVLSCVCSAPCCSVFRLCRCLILQMDAAEVAVNRSSIGLASCVMIDCSQGASSLPQSFLSC